MSVRWIWQRWPELTPDALYELLRLRSEIFVVEQNCVFNDMDGRDPACLHLRGTDDSGALVAYLRLVPPGGRGAPPSLGRVVVVRHRRGKALGRALMQEGMARCRRDHPGTAIKVSAQQHLEAFYGSLGFGRTGEPYLEDGIWHIDMLTTA